MIQPMLAYKVGKKEINYRSETVFLQPKLDGVRCVITKEGCYTRTGNQWMNVAHIELALEEFFKKNPDVILDGELYNHNLRDNFEKIISLVRKKKPTDKDREEAAELVEFHVYDYISDDLYTTRYYKLRDWFWYYSEYYNNSIKVTDNIVIRNHEEALEFHEENLMLGYEGSILRLNGGYEQKRSYNLQKFKDFHDKEATIIGFLEGKGKRLGTLGKFIMRDDEGIEFGCPPGKGYNYEQLTNILNNINDYIGKEATFTYFERTKAMSYRHPMFKTLRNYE
jgi:DNA ligase-1